MHREICKTKKIITKLFDGICDPCEDEVCQDRAKCVLDYASRIPKPRCECDFDCIDVPEEKIYGTDYKEYDSKCIMELKNCKNEYKPKKLKVKLYGKCKPCNEEKYCQKHAKCVNVPIKIDGKPYLNPECLCKIECDKVPEKTVCGINEKEYINQCELEKLAYQPITQ